VSKLVDNCMLRRILKFRRKEVMGGWGALHKEELHYSLSSPDTVKPSHMWEICISTVAVLY
jgi:hypothetical protein